MNKSSKIIPFSEENIICAMCGSSDVKTRQIKDYFEYGSGNSKVFLNAIISVHSCVKYSFEFTDNKADELRHEAVCRHLGLLTPREICDIRKNISKAEFSRQTGIGEASLSRWERGYLLQNAAMDNFLYLLGLPGNLEALRKRHNASEHVESESVFRCIVDINTLRKQQAEFRL